MSIKPDTWIRRMALEYQMIDPFVDHQVREEYYGGVLPKPQPVISYGLSSYGYDLRLGGEFKIFTNTLSAVVDPKAPTESAFVVVQGNVCLIPPNSYVLAHSLEYFRIPSNVLALCLGKSSYARAGIIVNVTPFEPGWEGEATLEISNATPLPVKLYAHEGIAQLVFFESNEPCELSYADRKGKYQRQRGITLPRI